ncbi:ribosome maturation factor RimP [Demequina sp. SYSU T00192]|uniref:Ribosome maturation factor RimP n=1 Tax=Demequina litoralis TaxID=3051660 RepID=A0ABT8G972_9MICO|nr:ribosome maturation factor RimP [Demequina sp. SYSU T00192]MDN4475681.1 ribosome maturation factor RimP [Demequina sp. SYSU T00192]
MDITSRIIELAAPEAEAAGLVLEGVDVAAAGKRSRVLVTVDLPETEVGSADLDAVAEASRRIGAVLDEANVPSTPYVLEVSTPGTDRVLTERRHFLRARTRMLALRLTDGTLEGRLTDVDGDELVLDVDGEERRVPLGEVTDGRIVVELKRLGEK